MVTIIVFIAISAISCAVFLVLRDVLISAGVGRGPAPLRRTKTVVDELPAKTLVGQIGQTFDRLVLETGILMTPMAAVIVMATTACFIAGSALFWFEGSAAASYGALIGAIIPIIYFVVRRGRRLREIREELPSVLDLLARAVRAGESVDQAIGMVGSEVSGALGSEFRWCVRQLELGSPVSSTMNSLVRRMPLMEVRLLASTLTVHRQTGGNLATTLECLSDVVRDRLNHRRQLLAMTGSGRFSALLIGGLAPLLFIGLWVFRPEHIESFFGSSLGTTLFGMGLALEVVGLVWIARLMRVR